MSQSIIKIEEVGNVLQQLEDAYFDIPFENSDLQNRAFVMASQQTPGRAYRAIGLRMFAKIRAIKEYKIQQERNAIDIEEKEAKIADPDTSDFDRRRLRLDILQITEGRAWGEKLLNDALRELNCLYAEFTKLPKYNREQFEAEEAAHFELRLSRQGKLSGAGESLANLTCDLPQWDSRIEVAQQYLSLTKKG